MQSYQMLIKSLLNEVKATRDSLDDLEKRINESITLTNKLLAACKTIGIKAVCIGVSHKLVKSSVKFTFGPFNSVFAEGNAKDGWPAIWRAVELAGIPGGCGNHDQHSYNAKLIDGAYKLVKGTWLKVD